MEEQLTTDEVAQVKEAIASYISTIGCIEFMQRIKPYKAHYLWVSSFVMLALIWIQALPLYIFFYPLVPILLINIVYFVDMNIVVWSITKAQTHLIKNNIKVDWDTMMDYTFEYFQELITNTNGKEEQ